MEKDKKYLYDILAVLIVVGVIALLALTATQCSVDCSSGTF